MLAGLDDFGPNFGPGCHQRCFDGSRFLQPCLGTLRLNVADFKRVRMTISLELYDWQTPLIFHRRIDGDTCMFRGNLLCRTDDDDGALVKIAHGMFMSKTPARRICRQAVERVDGQTNKFVGQHSTAAETGCAVVVIGDGDAGTGSNVVIGFEIEIADSTGVVVALQISPDLVVAISDPSREQAALGVQ